MPEIQNIPVSDMEIILSGIHTEHPAGGADSDFANSIYALFEEFRRDYYREEWRRLDENVRIYQGKYWDSANESKENPDIVPKSVTPIITSVIENIKADLSDELPEAVIQPDASDKTILAKVLTKVIEQELDVCDWERSYGLACHDMLQDGWTVFEVGHDPFLNQGNGGAYIRYIVNKNFMCDPQVSDMQDGRACFIIDKKPYDWFRQRYPEQYPYMTGDEDLLEDGHDNFDSTTEPSQKRSFRLIEMWVKEYDPKKNLSKIHFVKVAGHQVLENSADAYPNGYYAHGRYPFEIARLFPQKGSQLGIGICDLFKNTQMYADKIDSILLENALRAARPRLFVVKDLIDFEDARDFSKSVVSVEGSPDQAVKWMETQPLPSYMMNYILNKQQSIKNEAGANDQSRGQTGGGVTASSAITALQDMSTKRSRMEAREIATTFKHAVRIMIDVLREKDIVTRNIPITVQGQTLFMPFDRRSLVKLFADGAELPVEASISIKTARQTRYAKMSHNELWLQMMNSLKDRCDPVIMLEGLEMDEKESLLECIQKAQQGGMLQLQQQNAQLMQMCQQMQEQLKTYKSAVSSMQADALAPEQQAEQEPERAESPGIDASEAAARMA